jgi:putative addiction module killer protein
MIEMRETTEFSQWLSGLRDQRAGDRIRVRLRRLSLGNPGDVKSVGEGVSEMRIDYGPGYRVYFKRRGQALIFLLGGGSKQTQDADIKAALKLARNLGD